MLTDAAALGGALVASRLATRPARGPWTFGLGRAEILAAQANGLTLLLVGIWIVYGAVRRLVNPPNVHGGVVLVVALAGVAVNLVATGVLARGDRESLNMRGAFLHIATDLAAFAGTASPARSSSSPAEPLRRDRGASRAALSSARAGRSYGTPAASSSKPRRPGSIRRRSPARWPTTATSSRCTTCTSGPSRAASRRSPRMCSSRRTPTVTSARRRLQHVLEERFHLHHVTLQVDHVARREQPVELHRR